MIVTLSFNKASSRGSDLLHFNLNLFKDSPLQILHNSFFKIKNNVLFSYSHKLGLLPSFSNAKRDSEEINHIHDGPFSASQILKDKSYTFCTYIYTHTWVCVLKLRDSSFKITQTFLLLR